MTTEDSSKLSGPEDSSAFDFAGNFDFGTLTSQRLVQFEDGLVQSMTEWEKVCICIDSNVEATWLLADLVCSLMSADQSMGKRPQVLRYVSFVYRVLYSKVD